MPLFQRKNNDPVDTIGERWMLPLIQSAHKPKKEGNCQSSGSLLLYTPPRKVVKTSAAFFIMYVALWAYCAVYPSSEMYWLNAVDKTFTRVVPRDMLMNVGLISRTQNFEKDLNVSKVLTDFIQKRERTSKEANDDGGKKRECLDIGTPNFTKKMLWRMKHDRRPILGLLVDKTTLKLYAEALQLKYPENIHAGGCDDIPNVEGEDGIKDFAFKASHTSSCNIIVKDGTIIGHKKCLASNYIYGSLKGKKVTNALLKDQCKKWISRVYSVTEWGYQIVKPSILMEKLIPDAIDFKCYTFDGKTDFVHVDRTNLEMRKTGRAFYDGNTFDIIPTIFDIPTSHPFETPIIDSPQSDYLHKSIIAKAVNLCNHIGIGLDFARIDLMMMAEDSDTVTTELDNEESAITRGGDEDDFYFQVGEITLYPVSGFQIFRPGQAEVHGNNWCLPKNHGPED
mmetsp:Transcript_29727/g.50597  ORF Transcript_29727/g.50597 Transcript_29727/m.50597 type:complete len:452 (+) Transcript_29727:78-1433(+)